MGQETFEIEVDIPAQGVQDPELRAELDDIKETLRRWAGPKHTLESSGPEDRVGMSFVRLQIEQCPDGVAVSPWMSLIYGRGTLSEGNLKANGVTDVDGQIRPEMILKQEGGRVYGRPERIGPYLLRTKDGKLVLPDGHNDQLDPNLRRILELINSDPRLPEFLCATESA